MAKDKKLYNWDPEKAKRWGETQRARNAAKRKILEEAGDGSVSSSGGAADTGGGVHDPLGGGRKSSGKRSNKGSYAFGDDPDQPGKKDGEGKSEDPGEGNQTGGVVIDLEAIRRGVPNLMKLTVLVFDNWARALTDHKAAKVVVYFDKLSDEEAGTCTAFAWPWIQAAIPRWIMRHPGMALCCVIAFIGFMKLRFKIVRDNVSQGTETRAVA